MFKRTLTWTVMREYADELRRDVWTFREIDSNICLIAYNEETRETKRHHWRAERYYDAYDRRGRTLERDHVPTPLDVIAEIVSLWRSQEINVLDGPGAGAKVLLNSGARCIP